MRKGSTGIILALLLLASAVIFPQVTRDVSVVNISVPVRVFDGSRFVDSLKLEDFDLYEDGRPQSVLAAYLVRGSDVQRREGPLKAIAPVTRRHFVLLFQMMEYLPELNAAINLFFDEVLRNGDSVDLVTPRKTYRLAASAALDAGRRKAKQEFISKVRQDILVDSGTYNSIIRDMISNLEAIQGGDNREIGNSSFELNAYRDNLQRLEALQAIDLTKMSAFARELKKHPGAKHVFLFFQKERVPQFTTRALMEFLTYASPEETLKVHELMSQVRREVPIDREAIEKAFADASVDVHFLYITRSKKDIALDVERQTANETAVMAPRTGDIYNAFRDIAAATGGTADASWNPSELLKKAAAASEQYYLLYYRPQSYKADGIFHTITVKVREGTYRVSHRTGYVAEEEMPAAALESPVEHPADWSVQEPAAGVLPQVETISPDSTGAAAPADSLLHSAAAYCRRLQDAALHFSCREEVRERLSRALQPKAEILMDTAPEQRGITVLRGGERLREWIYDYLLIRRGGGFQESRILREEDGKAKRVENARLDTARFEHSNVILGPVGLLGEEAQRTLSYRVIKEMDMEGEPAVILDARPKGENPSSLFGKAWVRIRDGAVLKIEWAPTSMGNYHKIEELAHAINAHPKIMFSSEYAFEKNGLRFPSAYSVVESYLGPAEAAKLTLSKTDVLYKDYKFFLVQTEVKF